MKENNTKKMMIIGIGSLALLSLITGWIMAKNLNRDESQERFKLTKDYKRIKDLKYEYAQERGQSLYLSMCAKCHRADGLGNLQNPPLLKSPTALGEPSEFLKVIVKGLSGELTRSGKTYNSIMPGFKNIPHTDLAHIANYIRINLNKLEASPIHPVEVVKAKVDTLTIKGTLKTKNLAQ